MPTLDEYRDPVLKDLGGTKSGLIDLDPDLTDRDAPRSIISSALFDGEKLSNAYGGSYIWVPHYSDSRRVLARGFRVRYITVFEPPSDGSYQLRLYGYGETPELPAEASATAIANQIHLLGDDLVEVPVFPTEDETAYEIHLPSRIGMGSSAGRLISKGGVGILLVNSDFSQPLARGLRWLLSPMIPFQGEDDVTGLHDAINRALFDIKIPDLYPISPSEPVGMRSTVFNPWGMVPWLEPQGVIGYYAPTEWKSVTTFKPPTTGTYTLALQTSVLYGPSATTLAHDATGAEIEAVLRGLTGIPPTASPAAISVTPQGAATTYTIQWVTQHHAAQIVPSRGTILESLSYQQREPFPLSIVPSYKNDYEQPMLGEPGFPEGSSWFIHLLRPGNARIAPQTYPRKADGTLDMTQAPIRGSQWIESNTGLVNDLDQAVPSVEKVAPAAYRYALEAIARAAPRGEKAEWEGEGRMAAGLAAARQIYGRRGGRTVGRAWPPTTATHKGINFWMPD